jgi:tetratricopeptide (TPR) repeat protein
MYAKQSNKKELNKMIERLQKAKIIGLANGLSTMELWYDRKEHQKVVEIGTKLLKERQDDEFLNRLVGLSYLALDKPNKAKEHLSRSIKILRKDSSALFGLGVAFEKLDQPDKAFKLYQENLKLKRNDAKTQYRMGRIYYNQKQYEKAITYLKKSVEQEDRNADAHFYLGRAYEDGKGLKDRESYKIRESYERSIQLAPNNRVYLYRLARYYYKSRQSGKALTIYTKLLRTPNQTNKQKADIYFERGKLLFEERAWRGSLRDFMTVKRLEKEYPGIHVKLGDCYREMRRLGQALSSYKKALAILKKAEPDKDDPAQALKRKVYDKQSAQLNGYIADIYRDRRSSGMAIRYYRRAISFNPKDYRYHRRIGYLYKDKRRWSACRRHLRLYLKLAPASQLAVDRSEVTNDLRGCR